MVFNFARLNSSQRIKLTDFKLETVNFGWVSKIGNFKNYNYLLRTLYNFCHFEYLTFTLKFYTAKLYQTVIIEISIPFKLIWYMNFNLLKLQWLFCVEICSVKFKRIELIPYVKSWRCRIENWDLKMII